MKNLIYKEFKLAKHPTTFIFLLFGAMLLIPSYPYFVAYIYNCLAVFFIFMTGRETNDIFFTASLPVRKSDIVKARCLMIALIQLMQIVVSVPFAFISVAINPNPEGNIVGIEANAALFGLVFIMYALFDFIFITGFYKTGYKMGKYFLIGGIAVFVYIGVVEVIPHLSSAISAYIDRSDLHSQLMQLPVLAAGIAIYALTLVLAYKRSAASFEKVDL